MVSRLCVCIFLCMVLFFKIIFTVFHMLDVWCTADSILFYCFTAKITNTLFAGLLIIMVVKA